jgi:hypothetical protein
MPKGICQRGAIGLHAWPQLPLCCLLMHLKCCNFRPLGGSWMGLQALFHIATGRHERYTAPAGVHTTTPTPSPSEPGGPPLPLHLRPLGSYSSGARGTAAVGAGTLELSVNGLIDTTFSCYSSPKAADAMPKGAPSAGTHGHSCHFATLLMHLKCCNFRPLGPFGITLRAGWVMDGAAGFIPHCHWPSRTIYGTSRRTYDHANAKVQASQVRPCPCTCGLWGATAPALEARRR